MLKNNNTRERKYVSGNSQKKQPKLLIESCLTRKQKPIIHVWTKLIGVGINQLVQQILSLTDVTLLWRFDPRSGSKGINLL